MPSKRLILLCGGALLATSLAWAGEGSIPPPEAPFELPPLLRSPNRWRTVIIHHSASPSGSMAGIDRMHRGKGWDGVAYHFLITNGRGGKDGALHVSNRWTYQKHGAHAGAHRGPRDERNCYNEFGVGICLVGNFQKQAPTAPQLRTLSALVKRLQEDYEIAETEVVGHGHVRSTACPGRLFPWARLFAMMEREPPRHLYRREAQGTFDRCPWCLEREEQAAARGAGGPGLPPAPLLLRPR